MYNCTNPQGSEKDISAAPAAPGSSTLEISKNLPHYWELLCEVDLGSFEQ
jgi:hypothetical protein